MPFFDDAELERVKAGRREAETAAANNHQRELERRRPVYEVLVAGLREFPDAARQVDLPAAHMWRWEKARFFRHKVNCDCWTIAYAKNNDYLPIPINLSTVPSDDEIRAVAKELASRPTVRAAEVHGLLEDALRGHPRSFD
jgi:hypothetical protein